MVKIGITNPDRRVTGENLIQPLWGWVSDFQALHGILCRVMQFNPFGIGAGCMV